MPSGPITVPLLEVATVPVQESAPLPPLAAQEAALLVLHASVVDCPTLIVSGVAVKVLTAAGGAAGVTTSDALAGALAPPGPVQLRV